MELKKVQLTDEDLNFINHIYKPKIQSNILRVAIIWLIIVPIAPFYRYKGISKSLYERLEYGEALLWCFFILLSGWLLMVYLFYRNLNNDLRNNEKIRETVEIKRKDWKNNHKFKLFFGNKKLDALDIVMDKTKFYTCFKGDYVEIEYLPFSEYLIRYKIIKKEDLLELKKDGSYPSNLIS